MLHVMHAGKHFAVTVLTPGAFGILGTVVGVSLGHHLSQKSQREQWVRDKRTEEFRELQSALADYFTEEIAVESRGRTRNPEDQNKLLQLKATLFRVMRSRLFIAREIQRLDVEGRWQDALENFQRTAEVDVFVAAYDGIVQIIAESATRAP